MLRFDLIVIGGGAAGMFNAINVATLFPEKKVLLIEKSNKLLSKVKISGGGRCNVTHACFDPKELIQYYPRGAKELLSVFSKFSPLETAMWFSERGVKLKTEEDGRMFPITDSSQTIIDCFLKEAQIHRVTIWQNCEVTNIAPQEKGFILKLADGKELSCHKLLIATGGHPKLEHYKWIEKLGHTIIPPVPSLFTFNLIKNPISQLMGVSVKKARVKLLPLKMEEEGPLLITHWGFSGPVILKLSAFAARELFALNYNYDIQINWLPEMNDVELKNFFEHQKLNFGSQKIINRQGFELPLRLWSFLINKSGIDENKRWADVSNKEINKLIDTIQRDTYKAHGKTTFKEEFVTCGGVCLKEIDFKTMQSKKVNDLYFAGEVLDIDGVTGGFNFQAAWATAYIAAINMFKH
ncbi:MAG: NAD(P)/FAD-dependent oxidoreductase [Bacteroidia bacterium]